MVVSDVDRMDADDPLSGVRSRFHLPEGIVYLDGNSLGPLPRGVADRVAEVINRQWGQSLIRGWNDHDWIGLPARVGDRIGALIGAEPGSVVAADSTSLNVVKALGAALRLRPQRRVVLSDTGNFPTDLYMAQGLLRTVGDDHVLRLVDPDQVLQALDGPERADIAVVMLTQVDYRTGRMHDMATVTQAVHAAGAVAIWDLAHSAGAVPVDLAGCEVDLAVGCTYKYLNGGPGSPAFVYVAPRHAESTDPILSGWMGHQAPFDFDLDYRPAHGVQRMRVGTPPIIALAALDAALEVWDGVDMSVVRAKSVALTQQFVEGVKQRCAGHGLRLVSPADPAQRGSQVSFAHEHGFAIMQALIGEGVIGDFRAPDIMRFGFTPLYLRHSDVQTAIKVLAQVLDQRLWDSPAFHTKTRVT